MTRTVLLGTILALAMAGCASQSDLEAVRAQAAADNAATRDIAVQAQQCCETNSLKLDRMYQKLMSK
jgi:hypothetical protein